MEEDKNITMNEGSKMIEDLETEKISGGKSPNPRLASYYAVLDELNGKTCKFCKKNLSSRQFWRSMWVMRAKC